MLEMLNVFLNVQVPDPDDARRRRLLNIIILGVSVVTLFVILSNLFFPAEPAEIPFEFWAILFLFINAGLYWLNRKYSGVLASSLFLLVLTTMIFVADEPSALIQGRSLLFFSLPVAIASILIRPWTSFIISLGISLLLSLLALRENIVVNYFAIGGLLTLALVVWLSASGLETALKELRSINEELDHRVETRTKELASANERLQVLDHLKSQFVSDVSHELRTPVANLVAYLDMLQNKQMDPIRSQRYIAILQEETSRLTKMVNDILDLSRLELGRTEIVLEKVDLNYLAEQVVLAHQLRAETAGINLSFEPCDEVIFTNGDYDQINRVINNLVGNAVNYTNNGGIILVETYVDQNKAVISVKDTGTGIAPEDMPFLFVRFYRGQNAGSTTIAGSGLGLAISQEIMERHYGRIEVESELGKGSRFKAYFPLFN